MARRRSNSADPAHEPRPLLCIGGLDPSGGAGIMADLRAARAAGSEAVAVAGALTAQNSARVFAVRGVPRGWVRAQIEALEMETGFGAVKVGLVATDGSLREVGSWYRSSRAGPLVLDPVFEAGDGTALVSGSARRVLVREILPLAALLTPNRGEAEILAGFRIASGAAMERAARRITALGPAAVLIKGGHLAGLPRDLLWDGVRARWLRAPVRLRGRWHGLGCHLASAVAARLALGDALPRAVIVARACLMRGMLRARVLPSGRRSPRWSGGW